MWLYVLKVLITAVMVVAVAEVGKRNTLMAALLASLPITSVLAFVWLYVDTSNTEKIAELSSSIFWLVLPSLVLLAALPILLRSNMPFWLSLAGACLATAISYIVAVWVLRHFNVVL